MTEAAGPTTKRRSTCPSGQLGGTLRAHSGHHLVPPLVLTRF
jgi:hypothetical protein